MGTIATGHGAAIAWRRKYYPRFSPFTAAKTTIRLNCLCTKERNVSQDLKCIDLVINTFLMQFARLRDFVSNNKLSHLFHVPRFFASVQVKILAYSRYVRSLDVNGIYPEAILPPHVKYIMRIQLRHIVAISLAASERALAYRSDY